VACLIQAKLKLGQGVVLEVPGEDGTTLRLQAHIRRCRQFRDGWFDTLIQVLGPVELR
jgi:hypothetical protein